MRIALTAALTAAAVGTAFLGWPIAAGAYLFITVTPGLAVHLWLERNPHSLDLTLSALVVSPVLMGGIGVLLLLARLSLSVTARSPIVGTAGRHTSNPRTYPHASLGRELLQPRFTAASIAVFEVDRAACRAAAAE